MPRSENHQEGGGPPCVVMESGSGSIKIGWSGEPEPRGVLPCAGLEEAGDARPFRDGRVADWECLEAYWDHAFTNLLNIDTEKCHLLVSCALHETKDNRERMIQTLFETFAAPHVYIGSPPVFEMYAYGRENGVVLGSGAQCTYAVLVHEGLPDPRTLLRSSVAGETLTKWSAHVLQQAAGCVFLVRLFLRVVLERTHRLRLLDLRRLRDMVVGVRVRAPIGRGLALLDIALHDPGRVLRAGERARDVVDSPRHAPNIDEPYPRASANPTNMVISPRAPNILGHPICLGPPDSTEQRERPEHPTRSRCPIRGTRPITPRGC